MSPKPNSYEQILDAAEEVVIKVGASHMTLDAVAKKAGISKGGLIYNFPSKKKLLQAMVQRLINLIDKQRAEKCASLPDTPSRQVKAYILSMLDRDEKITGLSAALLAAISHNPKLLEPVHEKYTQLLKDLCPEGMNPDKAMVVALAADGLHLMELLQIASFTAEERKNLIAEMIRIADS